jgi:hypothetical protein
MSAASNQWHIDAELARRYVEDRVPGGLAVSVEQHLQRCADCRAELRPLASAERMDAVWAAVLERVQAPRVGLLERLLRRMHVDASTARLVSVTPMLRTSWAAGTVVVLLLALLAAGADRQAVWFLLVLAPVLPVAGVALTFGSAADPTQEVVAATPYSAVQLLALRTAIVVTSTFLPTALAAALMPVGAWLATAWLLPALALTAGTVALSTRLDAHVAASALTTGWLALVMLGVSQHDPFFPADPSVQLGSLAVLMLATAVLVYRGRDLAEILRRTR